MLNAVRINIWASDMDVTDVQSDHEAARNNSFAHSCETSGAGRLVGVVAPIACS